MILQRFAGSLRQSSTTCIVSLIAVSLLVLGIVLPISRQRSAIRQIREYDGAIEFRETAPAWLVRWLSAEHRESLAAIDCLAFFPTEASCKREYVFWSGPTPFSNRRIIDDEGLSLVARLPRLRELHLARTDISDAGMRYVGQLHDLEILGLALTDVTDTGLQHLESLTSLRELNLDGTHVTAVGVAALKRALPDCRISHQPRKPRFAINPGRPRWN